MGSIIDAYFMRKVIDSFKNAKEAPDIEEILGGELEGEDGGHGSGNWGHKGRPGLRGGSGNGKEGWTKGAGVGHGGNQYRGGNEYNYHSSKADWLNGLQGERQHEVQKWMQSKGSNLAEQEKNILTSGNESDIMKMLKAKAEARGYDDNFAKLARTNLSAEERKYLSDISSKSLEGTLELENLLYTGAPEERKKTANILNKLMGGEDFAGDVPQAEPEPIQPPKIDPIADPKNADPAEVKDVLEQKKLAFENALKDYYAHTGTWLNPDPEKQKYANAVEAARKEYHAYRDKARENPEYLDKIYVSESRKRLEAKGVENRPIQKYTTEMSEEAIIDRLGGGDKTKGSCASLALAYAACKAGYDVLDFRNGDSRAEFSHHFTDAVEMEGMSGTVRFAKFKGEIPNGKAALKAMEPGKEYVFDVGHHAAIVRLAENGKPQYLELQSSTKNGWTYFNGNPGYTLSTRFAANGNGYARMVEISQLASNPEFIKVLGYINTAPDKQHKGASGTIK